jgi:hypothetical protein
MEFEILFLNDFTPPTGEIAKILAVVLYSYREHQHLLIQHNLQFILLGIPC